MTTASDILNGAANVIEQNGWCRGHYSRPINGSYHYCVLGAIDKSAYTTQLERYDSLESQNVKEYMPRNEAVRMLLEYLVQEKKLANTNGSVAHWNDETPNLRKTTVVRTLRKAASSG